MKSTNIIFSNYRLCSVRFLGNSYVHLKGWCTGGRLGYRGYYSALFLNGFVISRTARSLSVDSVRQGQRGLFFRSFSVSLIKNLASLEKIAYPKMNKITGSNLFNLNSPIYEKLSEFLITNKINEDRHFSTNVNNLAYNSVLLSAKLNPWFITGFADAESSFSVFVIKKSTLRVGWELSASFQIGLDAKDKFLLDRIQAYFGVGKVYKGEKNIYRYLVRTLK